MKKFARVILLLGILNSFALAQDDLFNEDLGKIGTGDIQSGETKRKKSLEFDEGGSVEGLNKSPRNFGELTVDHRKKGKGHLYNRAINFDGDMKDTIKNMRYSQ